MSHTLRSRQLNPCDPLFWKSRGYPGRPVDWRERLEDMGYYDDNSTDEESTEYETESEYDSESEDESDYEDHCLRSNQNNPNNDEFWRLRGWTRRPDDWRERIRSVYATL
ncbi:uncharacterized protein LOC103314316 [Tribolium castaneum]|uniref:Uncharacterized protein n=1 Tax=Tribolium castaneum TaxID=7070 RepID=D6WZL4_TRICA|nr:PREDICTED: uncharacterized protein LOC103314316 [Tribolium castaneum]EFA09686.1 hypothetical protein TcasGA2_TC011814 [Tribolium castaneum]|eukprot:XP_008198249.1 PREDICTED: uncharacterized protein LOC103314316 [Tribolium castaneum]